MDMPADGNHQTIKLIGKIQIVHTPFPPLLTVLLSQFRIVQQRLYSVGQLLRIPGIKKQSRFAFHNCFWQAA